MTPRPMFVRQRTVVTALAALSAWPLAASAQPATQTVTITANGRVQELQAVPIAVQLVGVDQIERLGATNLGSLGAYVPGLQVEAEQPTQPLFSLRGIGTGDFGIGTDAPVGLYVNGVYAGKTGGALLDFNDVRRIEVLKGPQGTLFGRNSAGGAVSIVTNEPVARFAARGLVRLGSGDSRHVQAMVNQPLGTDWALRVAATGIRSQGWQRDELTGRDERGENNWSARVSLAGALGEAGRVVLSWDHAALSQRAVPAIGLLTAPDPDAGPDRWRDPRQAPLANDAEPNLEWRRFDGATLRLDVPLPLGELAATTAWRRFETRNHLDADGTALADNRLVLGNTEGNTTWQQELRLNGRRQGLDWLLGASYFTERATQTSEVATDTRTLDRLFQPAAGLTPFSLLGQLAPLFGLQGLDLVGLPWVERMHNTARTRSVAAYGDVIVPLGEHTRATAGLRWTRDHKRFSWFAPPRDATALDAGLARVDQAGMVPALVALGLVGADDAARLQTLLRSNQLIADSGSVADAPLSVEARWTNLSPRLVLDHRIGPAMVYASWTRGYQAGGFNTLQVASRYEPETVSSWELGIKGELPGPGLSFGAALFHYRFDNLQSLVLVPGGGDNAVPAYQVRVSDQRATGVDLEGRWRPLSWLTLSGAAEFIGQRYRQHVGIAGTDLGGQPVGTPIWTATLGAEATAPLAGGRARASLQGAYLGPQRCNDDSVLLGQCVQATGFRVGGARTRLDARLGWDSADTGRRWGVGLVVNNLVDRRDVTTVNTFLPGSPYASISPPRRMGVELRAEL